MDCFRLVTIALVTAHLFSPAFVSTAQEPGTQPDPQRFHLLETTIGDVETALVSGKTTCRTLVSLYIKRIETYDQSGPVLNAVQTINPHALSEADRLDAALKSTGPVGPLHCVPILLKDQFETSDMPTTYGSVIFKNFVPQRDATVVTKLKKAGAIIVARQTWVNLPPGTLDRLSELSETPTTRNPLQVDHPAGVAPEWQLTMQWWQLAKTRADPFVVPRLWPVWLGCDPAYRS